MASATNGSTPDDSLDAPISAVTVVSVPFEPAGAQDVKSKFAASYGHFVDRMDAVATTGSKSQQLLAGAVRFTAWLVGSYIISMPLGLVFGIVHMAAFTFSAVLVGSAIGYWVVPSLVGMRVWRPGWPEKAVIALAALNVAVVSGFVSYASGLLLPLLVVGALVIHFKKRFL
jgi:hypothetical protein